MRDAASEALCFQTAVSFRELYLIQNPSGQNTEEKNFAESFMCLWKHFRLKTSFLTSVSN